MAFFAIGQGDRIEADNLADTSVCGSIDFVGREFERTGGAFPPMTLSLPAAWTLKLGMFFIAFFRARIEVAVGIAGILMTMVVPGAGAFVAASTGIAVARATKAQRVRNTRMGFSVGSTRSG